MKLAASIGFCWLAVLVEPAIAASSLSPLELVEEVCIAPSTPKQVMDAGEAHAVRAGWSLDKHMSGSKQGIVGSNEEARDQPPMFDVKWWNFDPVAKDAGNFNVWMLGPAYPHQRVNTCQVSIPGAMREQVIALLRPMLKLGDATQTIFGVPGWILSGTVEKPDDGFKVLAVSEQTLILQDDKSGTDNPGLGGVGAQTTGAPGLPREARPMKTGVFTAIGVIDPKSETGRFPRGAFP